MNQRRRKGNDGMCNLVAEIEAGGGSERSHSHANSFTFCEKFFQPSLNA